MEILIGFLLGLVANEFCDVSPWLARKIIPRAAALWTRDRQLAQVYAEEWQAIVNERPGKLLKLLTAVGFLGAGIRTRGAGRVKASTLAGGFAMIKDRRLRPIERVAIAMSGVVFLAAVGGGVVILGLFALTPSLSLFLAGIVCLGAAGIYGVMNSALVRLTRGVRSRRAVMRSRGRT